MTPEAKPKTTKATKPKKEKSEKAPKPPKEKKLSGLDACAQVLKEKGEPMRCKEMVETVLAKGLRKTDGKTPAQTIYSAILREMNTKKGESRFKKTQRGLFVFNG